jgi:hypothetical protein
VSIGFSKGDAVLDLSIFNVASWRNDEYYEIY